MFFSLNLLQRLKGKLKLWLIACRINFFKKSKISYCFLSDCRQEHKAELHYKCTKIAEEVAKAQNCTIDLDIVCLATELLFRFYQVLATDLETFAKHAKRTTINMDDVLCFVRRNPQLVQLMSDFHKQQTTGKKPPDVAVPLPTSSGTDFKKSEEPPPKDSETKTAVHSPDSAQSLTEWFMDLE
ncbi:Centromere protein S [Clonorchis sinensis]|uniref:Centromere protein S n=1 Tax=Clonorchis sinensis TaxID=79923 RepID=A0A3R7CKW3_CLOSI|nr:Centromere protein S [Clonorchis sinensis]